MKIALIIDSLRFGGAQKCSVDLYEALQKEGHDVCFITYREHKQLKNADDVKNNTIYVPGLSKKYFLDYLDRFLGKIFGRTYGYIMSYFYTFWLKQRINLNSYDALLLVSDSGFFPFYKLNHKRLFYVAHSHKSSQYLFKWHTSFINRMLYKNIFKNKKIIAITNEIKKDLIDEFDVQEKNISVIPNIVNFERIEKLSHEKLKYPFDSNNDFIIHVGRHSKEKRVEDLIKCFKEVVLDHPDLKLVLVGEGPETRNLKIAVNKLALNSKVFFTGFMNNPYNLIKKSKLLVLCSKREGLPTVIIEALSLKTDAICSKCLSGPYEIYKDKYHYHTFNIGNLSEMKKMINNSLLNYNSPEKELVDDILFRYSENEITKKYLKLINE
tara:strand:+ start:5 stop:1150 length:1146 start_codon:yes stop_codon:yes gene_type:complete